MLFRFLQDGQEYLTHTRLEEEVRDELLAAGGRATLSDIQSVVNVDIVYVEEKAEVTHPLPPSLDRAILSSFFVFVFLSFTHLSIYLPPFLSFSLFVFFPFCFLSSSSSYIIHVYVNIQAITEQALEEANAANGRHGDDPEVMFVGDNTSELVTNWYVRIDPWTP